MIDAQPIERAAQVIDVLLVLELRRVHADHHQLVAYFRPSTPGAARGAGS